MVLYIELSEIRLNPLVRHGGQDYIKIDTGYLSVNDVQVLTAKNGKIVVPPGHYSTIEVIKDPARGDLEASVLDLSGCDADRVDIISDSLERVLLPSTVSFFCKLICPNLTDVTYPKSVGSFILNGKPGVKFECPRRIAMIAQYRESNIRSALRVLASGCNGITLRESLDVRSKTIDPSGLPLFRDKLRLVLEGFKKIAIL